MRGYTLQSVEDTLEVTTLVECMTKCLPTDTEVRCLSLSYDSESGICKLSNSVLTTGASGRPTTAQTYQGKY